MSEQTREINVDYVAHLARIELQEEESALFQAQLDQVLHYVDQIDELDLTNVEPMAHTIPVYNVLRQDTLGKSLDREVVIENAPASTDGEIRVPKIIDQ